MFNFRLYDKEQDIDLEDWSKQDYSNYYEDVQRFALFDETISQIFNS